LGLCNENFMGLHTAAGPGCYQRTYSPDFYNHQDGVSLGLFLQDRWKPFKRLTISPGLRFDYGYTENSLGQTVSNLFGVGPRLGVTIDLTGDEKTILSVFYGRANEVATLVPATVSDITATSTTQQYNPATMQWDHLRDSGGAGGFAIDPKLTPPHTDEVTLSLRRELFRNSMGGIDYTYKRYSNVWERVETNQVWDPSGTRVVGFVNGQPTQIFRLETPDSNWRIYQGIDFYVEARPTPNWELYGAYTLSWLYGTQAEELGQVTYTTAGNTAFYNPRQKVFYDGFLPEDRRHALKLRASYTSHGLSIGALFFYFSGTPISTMYWNGWDGDYTNKRSPQGTDPGSATNPRATRNDPSRWSELRLPDQIEVDVRLAYDFHALIRQHVILIADFFNLFNLAAPTYLDTTNTVDYGTVQARQAPFRFELGARYVY
jgi:hypothetical protein